MAIPDIDLAKQVCRIDGTDLEDVIEMSLRGATAMASDVARVNYEAVDMPPNVESWVLAVTAHWMANPEALAKNELSPGLQRLLDSVRKWDLG
jgi:hypothetical protein